MNEMVERVARILCADESWREIVTPEHLPEYVDQYWPNCIPAARAAIEAMREPTEAMKKQAAWEAAMGHQELTEAGAGAIYTGMVQAALKEPRP